MKTLPKFCENFCKLRHLCIRKLIICLDLSLATGIWEEGYGFCRCAK